MSTPTTVFSGNFNPVNLGLGIGTSIAAIVGGLIHAALTGGSLGSEGTNAAIAGFAQGISGQTDPISTFSTALSGGFNSIGSNAPLLTLIIAIVFGIVAVGLGFLPNVTSGNLALNSLGSGAGNSGLESFASIVGVSPSVISPYGLTPTG